MSIPASPASSATPARLSAAVCDFYLTVSGDVESLAWAGESLAIHFGLDGAEPGTFEESLVETNRYLAERACVGVGTRLLDAGCGIGGSSLWLARERGAHVTGITLSPHQVETARRHAALRGTGDGEAAFQLGDFMNTGFPEASFDVVWNLESLCHAHDVGAYLQHAHGLLRDGGRFACLDIFAGAGDPRELRAMRDGCAFGELRSAAEVAALLARAGFVDIEITDVRARAQRSVAVLRNMTEQTLLRLRFAEALLGEDTRQRQEHAGASLVCADAVLSGALDYAFIGARRAAR